MPNVTSTTHSEAKLQLSLANLMFLPFAIVVAPMVVTTAMYLGLVGSHYALPKDWPSARWMIDLGVPSDFATGHLVFFVMQLPTIVVLVILGAGLFLLHNRYSDQIAIVALLAIPLVDAYLISSTMVETRRLLHEQSSTLLERILFASDYLRTQLLTTIVLMFIVATFILWRCRIGYAAYTRRHTLVVSSTIGILVVGSWVLWQMT